MALCFAVFYGFLAYSFLHSVELLLWFTKESRILKMLSHQPYSVNSVKKLVYPELLPDPKNK